MTSCDFAEKYIGHRIVMIGEDPSYFPFSANAISLSMREVAPTGIIIGYTSTDDDDDCLLIKFDEPWDDVNYYLDQLHIFLLENEKRGYIVHMNEIELYSEPEPINVYPNKCKKCKAPALIRQNITFCSNLKCKKASQARKKYHNNNSVINYNYIICPTCSSKAVNMVYSNRAAVLETYRVVQCLNNHSWQWECLDGWILSASLAISYYKSADFMWSNAHHKFIEVEV